MLVKKSCLSLIFVEFATLLIASFWGLYFQAPSIVKSIFSILIWLSVFSFPYRYLVRNDMGKVVNYLILILLILGIIAILRSCLNFDRALYSFGNKWITLFFNEYCSLLYIPPLFMYMAVRPRNLRYLKVLIGIYLIYCFPFFDFSSQTLFFIVIVLAPFFVYFNLFYKVLIVAVVLKGLFFSVVGDNPVRAMILYVAFSFIAFVLAYVVKRKMIILSFFIVVIFTALFSYIPLLYRTNDEGIFVKLQEYMSEEKRTEDMSTDTRTFLYNEMSEDLRSKNSLIFGKGALSYYYSAYFDRGEKGKYGRMTSEVTFLNMLLHSGLVYVILYYFLLLYGALQAIYCGKNDFVKCIAIVAIGWFFNSFVCDMNGARFYHVVFFILLGCCFSKKWLNYSNKQVQCIFQRNGILRRKN